MARTLTGGAIVLALAAGTLAGCTAPSPSPPTNVTTSAAPSPTPTPLVASLRAPDEPTTLLDGTDLAVASSRALFVTSPVVVLAAAEDPEAQTAAASAAVALGAPLLLVPAEPSDGTDGPDTTGGSEDVSGSPTAEDATTPVEDAAWRTEIDRLDAEVVIGVGLAPATTGSLATARRSVSDLDAAQLEHALDLPVQEYQAGEELEAVQGLDGDRPVLLRPVPEETGSTSSSPPGDLDLPLLARPDPIPDLVLLVDGDPGTLPAIATARAVGLPVVTSRGDPRATGARVAAVHESIGPRTRVLAAGPGFGEYRSAADLDWRIRTAATGTELPGGGQLVFRDRRLVALYGSPGTAALGLLGEQDLDATVTRAHKLAARYQALSEETVVPAFEIIATVAARDAGPDGNYSDERPVEDLVPWVERAEAEGIYVLLDLQPGRTDFLTQAERYERLLRHPNVGLALDPEWRLEPDQVHLRQIGSVDVAEVNAVADWLAALTRENRLPQKAFVVHQFAPRMITDRRALDTSHPELATVIHVDGQGTQPGKAGTWAILRRDAPDGVHWGWKNFVDEDVPMLTAVQTMQIEPVPDLITYQ